MSHELSAMSYHPDKPDQPDKPDERDQPDQPDEPNGPDEPDGPKNCQIQDPTPTDGRVHRHDSLDVIMV